MILRRKDDNCVNIYCNKLLTQYELDRQCNSWKYRFCIKCRRLTKTGRGTIEWKCLECGIIIGTATVIGSYYCSEVCREKTRSDWAKRRHKTRKLAAEIVKQGGIDKYKCKIVI